MDGTGSYRRNVEQLATFQKSSRGAPLYSLYVNRPLGRRIAAFAATTSLTPNAVSFISFGFSAAGIMLMALVPFGLTSGLLIAALLIVGYAVDSADGQLARLTGGGSPQGEWLDHSLDMAKLSGLHLAVLISAIRWPDGLGWWPAISAGVFEFAAVCSFFGLMLTDLLRRRDGVEAPARSVALWFRLAGIPTDYGVLCLWFVVWGARPLFFVGYALLAAANLGYLLVGSVSRFGQLRPRAGAVDSTSTARFPHKEHSVS